MDLHKTNKASIKALEEKALEHCNQEPLAFIESIQDFGYLLAFDTQEYTITHASENAFLLFKASKHMLIGASVLDFIDRDTYHSIANVSSRTTAKAQRTRVCELCINEVHLELSLFRIDQITVLEFITLDSRRNQSPADYTMNWILNVFKGQTTSQELMTLATKLLRDLSGFDRVMLYKFYSDDSGEVIAEAKKEAVEGYMGMRFPAFDIPPGARELFKKIPFRYIKNTSAESVRIYHSVEDLPTLDLSLSLLRAVSPVHTQYLKNMEVTSSLSLPIIIQDRLWGLLACHNLSEFSLSPQLQYTLQLFNSLFSKYLEDLQDRESEVLLKPVKQIAQNLLQLDQSRDYNKKRWSAYAETLAQTLECDGLALQIGEALYNWGCCPNNEVLVGYIDRYLETSKMHFMQNTQELNHQQWQEVKSVLGMNASSHDFKVFLLFFRTPEKLVEPWAGNPKKDLVVENDTIRLHPRGSFKEFKIDSSDKAKLWSSEEIKNAAKLRSLLFEAGISVQLKEKEYLNLMVRELNHKIRNIAGLVLSVTHQTQIDNNNVAAYKTQVEDRVLAIMAAVNLIASNSKTISIRNLLKNTVMPLMPSTEAILITGKTIELPPNYATLLALVFQELATNALKYGALSVKEGRVHISLISKENDFEIIWKEANGPKVSKPRKLGFGTTLLDQAIKFELGGSSNKAFHPEGFSMKISLPKVTKHFKNEDAVGSKSTSLDPSDNPVILVLEDQFLIAEELKALINSFDLGGCKTVATVSEALVQIKTHPYHLALLDVHLKDEDCLQVALACKAKELPFFYITGNDQVLLDSASFPEAPLLIKPVNKKLLKQKLVDFFS